MHMSFFGGGGGLVIVSGRDLVLRWQPYSEVARQIQYFIRFALDKAKWRNGLRLFCLLN